MKVTVAATQMACSWDWEENIAKAEGIIRQAAAAGAQIILPQEMFSLHFFAFMDWKSEYFKFAEAVDGPTVMHMRGVAKDLGVVIPVNFFERANNAYFNTNAVIDADGSVLGIYRKTHIPGGPPGCFEKIYTSYGDTGFQAFDTAYGRIGAAVCWDQWFPESARIMCLKGAELLFYPTGIGSDCHDHWEVVMRGHAGANLTPLIASNRVGYEKGDLGQIHLLGAGLHCRAAGGNSPTGRQDQRDFHHRDIRPRSHPGNARQLGCFPGQKTGCLWPAADHGWLDTGASRPIRPGQKNKGREK